MRRMLSLIVALLLVVTVFAGCQTKPITTTTTAPQETKPEKGSSLVEYDPDRRIYFLCNNRYCNFYDDVTLVNRVSGYILSKDELKLDSISVSVPTTHPYTIDVYEENVERGTEYILNKPNAMKFYIYEAAQGIDFYDQDSEQYANAVQEALAQFKELKADDLPMFYYYSYSIMFDNTVPYPDEEITYVDITIEGQIYRQDIGCVRLISKENFPLDYEISKRNSVLNVMNTFYNEGIFQFNILQKITADEDTTVRELTFLGDDWTVLSLRVQGTVGGMKSNFEWDGKTPFDLYKGDAVSISGVLYNPHLDGLNYQLLLQAVLGTEVNSKMYGYSFEQRMTFLPNPYELYAIIFDGVDMEPYYRGYYYKYNELWRKAYLDKIPKE